MTDLSDTLIDITRTAAQLHGDAVVIDARLLLEFMGSRENAVANDCAQDWDEAWVNAFGPTDTHINIAKHK